MHDIVIVEHPSPGEIFYLARGYKPFGMGTAAVPVNTGGPLNPQQGVAIKAWVGLTRWVEDGDEPDRYVEEVERGV